MSVRQFHVGAHPVYKALRRGDGPDKGAIAAMYTSDLTQALTKTDLLTQHMNKWEMFFAEDLPVTYNSLTAEELVEVLRFLRPDSILRQNGAPEGEVLALLDHNKPARVAAGIMLPDLMITIHIVASNFGAPDHVALHQLCCDDPEHLGCL